MLVLQRKLRALLVALAFTLGAWSAVPAAHVAAATSSSTNPDPQPIKVTKTSWGSIKMYDTQSLLQRKEVTIKTVYTQRKATAKSQAGYVNPDSSLRAGVDYGYYDLALIWLYLHGDYVCGYVLTDTESQTGPAQGNLQADLYVTVGAAHEYHPWTYDKDFNTSIAEESPCYNYDDGFAQWTADGSGALKWPSGVSASSGPATASGVEGG